MTTSVTDLTPEADGSLSSEQIISLIEDVRDEPEWRENAAVEEDILAGNQLPQDTLAKMREFGIPPIISNLIEPVIASMVGFEAATRTDPIVLPDNDQSQEGAEAYNALLKEQTRLARFNEGCSDAFESAAKIGIGWIEVTRNSDPAKPDFYVGSVPWREMWWDWRARKADLTDARYFLRRKWWDRDILATILPFAKDTIMRATSGWPGGFLGDWDTADSDGSSRMGRSIDEYNRYGTYGSLEIQEWIDTEYRRVALFEILYRVPKMATMMLFPSGQKVEYDKDNRFHNAAVASGQVELVVGPSTTLRQAFYLGHEKILDRPLSGQEPHYIPVFARREGGDGSPYGYIRSMKSPQEAYNQRYARVLHDLLARRVLASENAVVDHAQAKRDVNRANAYIQLKGNTGATGTERFEILTNTDMTQFSMALMETAKADIHAASGIPREFVGAVSGANQSGVAIDSLIDQGQKVLGPFLRNYLEARRRAAQRLLDMIVVDMQGKPDVEVRTEPTMAAASKTIILNRRTDEGGIDNQTAWLRTHVALSETPASPTYRAQQFGQMTEVMKSLPPELSAAMLDMFVDMSETPHKREMLERIRQITGFGPEPEDPAERERIAQEKQQQQQLQQMEVDLQIREREAAIAKLVAEAEFIAARARKHAGVDTAHTEARTYAELAKVQRAAEDSEREDIALEGELVTASERLALETRRAAGEDERAEVELQRKMVETGGRLAVDAQKSRDQKAIAEQRPAAT